MHGTRASEGTVELCYNGRWRAVCSSLAEEYLPWDYNEAHVVCRQLGYPDTLYTYESVLQDLPVSKLPLEWSCVGNELSIADCNSTMIHPLKCVAVSVTCLPIINGKTVMKEGTINSTLFSFIFQQFFHLFSCRFYLNTK